MASLRTFSEQHPAEDMREYFPAFFLVVHLVFMFTLLLVPELIAGVRVTEQSQQEETRTSAHSFPKAVSVSPVFFLGNF